MIVFRRLRPDGSRDPEFSVKFSYRGRQVLRKTPFRDARKAQAFGNRIKDGLMMDEADVVMEALETIRRRNVWATIGHVAERILDEGVKLRKTSRDTRRIINDLRLVVAHAKGWWTTHKGGVRGVKIGTMIPDVAKVDAMPTSMLNGELVRQYFAARLGSEVLDWVTPGEGNRSINSTLSHARDAFRGNCRVVLQGLKLPDLTDFMTHRMLPQEGGEPEPIEGNAFRAMCVAARLLRQTDEEMWLCNVIFRRTGMRSGSVLAFRSDWLRQLQDGWWIQVRERKGGTAMYEVPISDWLAERIRARGAGLVLWRGLSDNARAEKVNKAHNEWVKRIIGGAGERVQGNHRCRDTVATGLMCWMGWEVAKEALGHERSDTTRRHYARLRMDVTQGMRREWAAWQRLRPAGGREVKNLDQASPSMTART